LSLYAILLGWLHGREKMQASTQLDLHCSGGAAHCPKDGGAGRGWQRDGL
jgi:hypothetical protein